jgi:3,4-dihydroxy-2-butanone 4-phosphate synthase
VSLAPIEEAVAAIGRGEMVLVIDDVDRENEGDLIMAAEKVTAPAIAFMVRHTSGVICAPLTGERLDALEIGLMVPANTESHRTAFTVTVDACRGTGWRDWRRLACWRRWSMTTGRWPACPTSSGLPPSTIWC